MKRRCKVSVLVLLISLWGPLRAEAQESGKEKAGSESSLTLEFQASTLPEMKVRLVKSLVFPVLTGESPLTQGNNIQVDFAGEVSPISMNVLGDILLNPIAFLQIGAGTRVGTGWNIALGNGMGINRPEGIRISSLPRKREIDGTPLDGLTADFYGGGALQFDLGMVIPGNWTHVFFRTWHEARYRTFSGAASGEPWIFENDDGENVNGWIYKGSFLLGYLTPAIPILDLIGFMAEISRTFYHTPGGSTWGENDPQWILSGVLNFRFSETLSAGVLVQVRTRKNYLDGDLNNTEKYYFRDRVIDASHPRKFVFYRAAAILSWRLR
jgi:hypothetical protein